jgi:hypothetical protein
MRSGLIEFPLDNGLAVVGWIDTRDESAAERQRGAQQLPPCYHLDIRLNTCPKSSEAPSGSDVLGETERAERAVQALRIRLLSWRGVARMAVGLRL